jgi:D-beta-D-heptose 7-phosphate kinase/D-beta-D-heptose 1-phosphate adenosyltransferase
MDVKNTNTGASIATPESVARIFEVYKSKNGERLPLVAVSGGFDPLHVGHLRHIQCAALLKGHDGLLVVIVNGDGFLKRKKGYVFMPLEERLEMIAAIKGVDFVVPWDDGTQFVTGAIEVIKPNVFAKGGDRQSEKDVPEYETCVKVGCAVVFGIGGKEKLQSSSELVAKAMHQDVQK